MTRLPKTLAAAMGLLLAAAVGLAAEAPAVTQADVDQAVEALAKYDLGQDLTPVGRLAGMLRQISGNDALARHAEQRLAGLLASQAALEAKLRACQFLAIIGTDASVPALEKLLADPRTTHMACYALQPNPGPKALDALRRALTKTAGPSRIAILSVLAQRRDALSVPLAAGLVGDADAAVAEAALAALGNIGGTDAAKALAGARRSAPEVLRPAATDAALQCAARLAADGHKDQAVAIYKDVLAGDEPLRFHRGALLGLMNVAGEEAVPLVLKTLRSNDAKLRAAAIANIPAIQGKDIAERFARELPDLPPDAQALLVSALAERGGPAARDAVAKAASSDHPDVRAAALAALGTVGDAGSVDLLARAVAAGRTDAEKGAALVSLRRLAGDGVDEAIGRAMAAAQPQARADLVQVLVSRGAAGAVPALVKEARGTDATVAKAALKALAVLAGPAEAPTLVDVLTALAADAARDDAERAAIEVSRKMTDDAARPAAALAALGKAKDAAVRGSLLRVLRGIGGAKALETVQAALKDAQPAVQDAALRALADWPDTAALPTLINMYQTTPSETHRVVALRGCVRLLGAAGGRPTPDVLGAYKDLLGRAARPEDRKLLLGGLGAISHPDALAMAESLTADPDVGAEATLAALQVARAIAASYPVQAKAAMLKLADAAKDDAVRQQARQVVAQVESFQDYITAWQVSGPYVEEGKAYTALFDTVFAPEQIGAKAEWRLLPAVATGQPFVFDLLVVLGGEQRVGYVRTWFRAEKAQDARLELGTDDGVKAWLNGQVVHQNNTGRACVPGQDKAQVKLRAGWNLLLVKVTQCVGPWSFCARLAQPDGSPLTGLEFDCLRE